MRMYMSKLARWSPSNLQVTLQRGRGSMGELGSSDVAEIMSKNNGTGAEGLNSRRMKHNFHTLHRKVPVYGPSCTARDWHSTA